MKLMLFLAALGMVTSFCAAYDGGQDRGSPDGKPGGEHKPYDGGSFHGDGYHDWLSPWDGHTTKPMHPDHSQLFTTYTYPVYYSYSVPYYYYYPNYPYYNWYYAPQYNDLWWDPWWATNVYGTGGGKYTFKSDWSYHSGFGFGDP
jgi:hypothetical protein